MKIEAALRLPSWLERVNTLKPEGLISNEAVFIPNPNFESSEF
jgi:hypothetical protein